MDSVSALAQIMLCRDSPHFAISVIPSSIYITSDIALLRLTFIVSRFDFDCYSTHLACHVPCDSATHHMSPSTSFALISFSLRFSLDSLSSTLRANFHLLASSA